MVKLTVSVPFAEREAVDWFLRLQNPHADEQDYLAFQAWLEARPHNRAAYDKVDRLWTELGQPGLVQTLKRRKAAGPAWLRAAGGFGAVAAGLAAAIVLGGAYRGAPRVYASPPAESRQVALKDGSTLDLSPGSQVTVRLGWRGRQAQLAAGEVLFDIAHDARRPFKVEVEDHSIEVLGTAFDVRRRQGGFQVAVLRGLVRVSGGEDQPVSLRRGDHYDHGPGVKPAVQRTAPQDLEQWRAGRRIYRNAPLSDVAADLSLAMDRPIRLDPVIGALRFTGVLRISRDEEDMVRQLQAVLPLQVRESAMGVELTARAP